MKKRIAMQLPGLEEKLSERAARHFTSIHSMINAESYEWQSIEGIGKKKAETIITEIHKGDK